MKAARKFLNKGKDNTNAVSWTADSHTYTTEDKGGKANVYNDFVISTGGSAVVLDVEDIDVLIAEAQRFVEAAKVVRNDLDAKGVQLDD
jgi:hypothetical protein